MMKRKVISVVLVMVMMLGLASGIAAARGSYLGTLTIINCKDWVSLRKSASTSAARVATVPLGASVEAYYYNSEYTECKYNGQWGYILSTYLSNSNYSGSAASSNSGYVGKLQVINCNEFVTLRKTASTSGAAVTRVAKGETVDCYTHNSQFYRCYYNGLSGYILREYLGYASSYEPNWDSGYREPGRYIGGHGEYYLGTHYVINFKDWVSLRSSPSTSASRITTVPLGAAVEAYYDKSDNFTLCIYNGYQGYILSSYLTSAYEPEPRHFGGYGGGGSMHGSYAGTYYVINCKDWVSLRSSASTTASRITTVPLGAAVDAYYFNAEFMKCEYNGYTGYILSSYLGSSPSYRSPMPDYGGGDYLGTMRIINCTDWVSLRSSPSTKASRITTVPLGARVEAYYYNSEFAECYYDGYRGYILRSYLG